MIRINLKSHVRSGGIVVRDGILIIKTTRFSDVIRLSLKVVQPSTNVHHGVHDDGVIDDDMTKMMTVSTQRLLIKCDGMTRTIKHVLIYSSLLFW